MHSPETPTTAPPPASPGRPAPLSGGAPHRSGPVPRRSPGTPGPSLRAGLSLTLRWLFAGVVLLHALMVLAQPFLAGGSLDGHALPLLIHAAIGGTLIPVSMVLVVLGVLAWKPGGGSPWGPFLALTLVVLEIAQVALGHLHLLSVHVPLGVVITLLAVMLSVVALRRLRRGGSHG